MLSSSELACGFEEADLALGVINLGVEDGGASASAVDAGAAAVVVVALGRGANWVFAGGLVIDESGSDWRGASFHLCHPEITPGLRI